MKSNYVKFSCNKFENINAYYTRDVFTENHAITILPSLVPVFHQSQLFTLPEISINSILYDGFRFKKKISR